MSSCDADNFNLSLNLEAGGSVLSDNIDSLNSTTLKLGNSNATKVEISDSGIPTDIKGSLNATQGLSVTSHITTNGYLQFSDIKAPNNPSNAQGRLYKKTGNDGIFWKPDAAGSEVDLTATGASSGWQDDGEVVRLVTLTDKVGVGNSNPSAFFEVRRKNRGEEDHIQLVVSDDLNVDTYNLNVNLNNKGSVVISGEDSVYRQAVVMAADNAGSNTILGVSRSNNSGSTWEPVMVATQDLKFGIANNNPQHTLDVSGDIKTSSFIQLVDISAPSNPSNGSGRLYKKTGNDGIFWKPDAAGSEVDLTAAGSGDVTSAINITDNAIVRGDGGAKGVESSNWTIIGDKMAVAASSTDYLLDIHNTAASGGQGFRVRAGESDGDITFKVTDQDETFPIMEMSGSGKITMGKTFIETMNAKGVVYGIDNQHTIPGTTDFNTENGLYRIGGVDVVNVEQTLTNKTLTSTSNNITAKGLHSATTTVNVSSAAAPTSGQILTATSSTNATWQSPASKTIRLPHTWAIAGEIKVASGDTDFLIPFFVSLASGQTAKLVSCRYAINSGTSATVKIQRNGADVAGFTGISVTTTPSSTDPSDVSLSSNDKLAIVVTGVSGTPKNMSFTLFIEHTV